MPYKNFAGGLYFARQPATKAGVGAHFGIIDVGNRRRAPTRRREPVVWHLRQPGITTSWLHETEPWQILDKIRNEAAALQRLRIAQQYNPRYAIHRDNCEHFARFIAYGRWESKQVQAVTVIGLITLVALAADEDQKYPRRRRRAA